METIMTPSEMVFDGDMSSKWELWKRDFYTYLTTSRKHEESDGRKLNTLLNLIGPQGRQIFESFRLFGNVTLETVIREFDDYCRNKLVESLKFHTMEKSPDQPFDRFLSEMKSQAAKCEFACGNCRTSYVDRMLIDKLIMYCRDKGVQKELLTNPNLTLNAVENACRSVEMSRHLMPNVRNESSRDFVQNTEFKVPSIPVAQSFSSLMKPPPTPPEFLRETAQKMQPIISAETSTLIPAKRESSFDSSSTVNRDNSSYGRSIVNNDYRDWSESYSSHYSDRSSSGDYQRRDGNHSEYGCIGDRMRPPGEANCDSRPSRFDNMYFQPIKSQEDAKTSSNHSESYSDNQYWERRNPRLDEERKYRDDSGRRDEQIPYQGREDRGLSKQSWRQDDENDESSDQSCSSSHPYGSWTSVEQNGDDMLKPSPSKIRRTPQKESAGTMSPMAHEMLTRKRVRDMLTPTPSKDNRKMREKREVETDPEVIARRQKQIDYGKNTLGYERYRELVPKEQRSKMHPKTPPIGIKFSRRAWDGLVRVWRQRLHFWDSPADGGGNPECLEIPSDMSDCSSIDGSLPNTPVHEIKRVKSERTSRFSSSRFPPHNARDDDDSGCTPLAD